MNLSQASLQIYEDLLSIQGFSLKQLQNRSLNQNHAVWKSLLKIQASNRMNDHLQAIKQLKLAKSQISAFARTTTSKENEKIYRKIMISILSHLVNRQFAAKKYKQSIESLKQLTAQFTDIQSANQAIYNMFGFSSLVAIDNYNIQSNAQFKYPAESQVSFFYIVGKVKMANYKIHQAKLAYEKMLMLKSSVGLSQYILIRVLDYLAEIQPVQYRPQYEKAKSMANQNVVFSRQQKEFSQTIIKCLLQKQYELHRSKSQIQAKQKITKKLLWMYLNSMITNESLLQKNKTTYFHSLLNAFSKQTSPTVLNQILENASISKQVRQYYQNKFKRVNHIFLNYYFRVLKNSKKGNSNLKNQSSNNNSVNNSVTKPLIPMNVLIQDKRRTVLRQIPRDLNRAKQILKKCIIGSNLMKINYGNTAMKRKFVKIEQKQLVWADEEAQIQYSASKIKWKHILGIVYGKVSQNLTKPKFAYLLPWRCFSLITHERSYDFYCQNQSQIFFWLQGISYQLQTFHKNTQTYPYYTKGRALWKMALMKMNSKFQDPKTKYECLNAGSVLNFKRSMQIITK